MSNLTSVFLNLYNFSHFKKGKSYGGWTSCQKEGVFTEVCEIYRKENFEELYFPLLIPFNSKFNNNLSPKILTQKGDVFILRNDITPQIVERFKDEKNLKKIYYFDRIFKYSREGEIKEFIQAGIEIINRNKDSIFEAIKLALKTLEFLDEKNYVLSLKDIKGKEIDNSFFERLGNKRIILDESLSPIRKYYTGIYFEGFLSYLPFEVLRGGEYEIGGKKCVGFAMELPLDLAYLRGGSWKLP